MNYFFAGNSLHNIDINVKEFTNQSANWFESMDLKITRYGNSRGKIVKNRFAKLESLYKILNNDSLCLYSEYRYSLDEEPYEEKNYQAKVILTPTYFYFAIYTDVNDLRAFIDSVKTYCPLINLYDKHYVYQETPWFGGGYVNQVFASDSAHTSFSIYRELLSHYNQLSRKQLAHEYIKDVYLYNYYSYDLLSKLPVERQSSLMAIMKSNGTSLNTELGWEWYVDDLNLSTVRQILFDNNVIPVMLDKKKEIIHVQNELITILRP